MKWLHLHWVDASPQDSSPHLPRNDKKALTLLKNQTIEKQRKISSYQD